MKPILYLGVSNTSDNGSDDRVRRHHALLYLVEVAYGDRGKIQLFDLHGGLRSTHGIGKKGHSLLDDHGPASNKGCCQH